ncbi:MAG: putative FKBP-type peptidyl-prolyl cis-trans isomerase [Methanosaeta sp. PtaU1.Bin028]|nr:MAG: putative FKBP-type peptidyl-prolyl cis-trans isomerase [Methanosaeta sp. PtaU1.Bin028]
MTLKNGDFILLDYTESVGGVPILTTDEQLAKDKGIFDEEASYGPRIIILGAGQIVAGLEEELLGKEVGFSGTVQVPPEKAHGVTDPANVQTVMANRFKQEKPLPGMRVSLDGKMGVVSRIIGRRITVDLNHPLAGQDVTFDYKIQGQIEDREEKLKGMIKAFARLELQARIIDDAAEIQTPWELSYYQEWVMIRRGLADMILRTLELKEVRFVETHTGQRVTSQLISPPSKSEPDLAAAEGPGQQ